MPLMRLDDQGNPTYYLEDGMGSIVGLANNSGVEVAEFEYDSFGNLRSGATGMPNELGGDFRFQGQWLESNTDFYHFRARYYDPETGRFVSRDPIDIIETEPESSNPYQFVYNNPLIYSDPSGEITLMEINSSINMQNILNSSRQYVISQAKDKLLDEARGIAGNLMQAALKPLIPNMWMGNILDIYDRAGDTDNLSDLFEGFIFDKVCGFFKNIPYYDRVWIETQIQPNGEPHKDGFNCGDENIGVKPLKGWSKGSKNTMPNPDYLFKKGSPVKTDGKPKGWLIGDMKLTLGALQNKIVNAKNPNQWNAIHKYANYLNGHLYTPMTFFIVWNSKGAVEGTEAALQKEALEKGVFMYILNISG